MSIDDDLARLRAGLDEDERTARAADPSGLGWDVRSYVYEGIAAFPATEDPEIGGEVTVETRHMERQDPARTLRRVAALRRVIEAYEAHQESGTFDDRDLNGPGPDLWQGRQEAYELFFSALAEEYRKGDDTTD